jgi:hypothetical protein
MLTGHQLYPDWERLAELGDGVLEIDVLAETCWFNSVAIPRLSIATVLRTWLLADLEANRIPLDVIQSARLTARPRRGFDRRTGFLKNDHDFLLEGSIVAGGREYKTTVEEKNGQQAIVAK